MVAAAFHEVNHKVDLLGGRLSATSKRHSASVLLLRLFALSSAAAFSPSGQGAYFCFGDHNWYQLTPGRRSPFGQSAPLLKATARDFTREGIQLVQVGRFSDAAKLLEHSLALAPEQSQTAYFLGLAQERLGLPWKALNCYERAAYLDPSDVSVYIAMGYLLSRLRKHSAAAEALKTALRLKPHQGDLWAKLGILHLDSGRQDEALKALSTAVKLLPDDPTLRAALAGVLRAVGRFDESYKEQLRAAQLASAGTDGFLLTRKNIDKTSLAFAPATLAATAMSQTGHLMVGSGVGSVAAHLKSSALPESTPQEWIERLLRVHVTHIATKAECEWAIATAEMHAAAMGGWDGRGHHYQHKTNNIVIADNKELTQWVQVLLQKSIWPAMKMQFDIDTSELWLEDCFLVKYEASGQAGLGRHFDSSELSFNLLLSDPASFEGGGTAFFDAEQEVTVQPKRGEVLTHYSLLYHEGKPVLGGAPRYILAGFVRAQPLAKRWRELRPRAGPSEDSKVPS